MRILFILSRIEHGMVSFEYKGSWKNIVYGDPILTLPHLADITSVEHSVKIVNESYETINFDTNADIIGISTYTMTAY
jgi:hypothetical protein